jgi:hypothetical protein
MLALLNIIMGVAYVYGIVCCLEAALRHGHRETETSDRVEMNSGPGKERQRVQYSAWREVTPRFGAARPAHKHRINIASRWICASPKVESSGHRPRESPATARQRPDRWLPAVPAEGLGPVR